MGETHALFFLAATPLGTKDGAIFPPDLGMAARVEALRGHPHLSVCNERLGSCLASVRGRRKSPTWGSLRAVLWPRLRWRSWL